MDKNETEEVLSYIALQAVDEKSKKNIEEKAKKWKEDDEDIFSDASDKYKEIRKRLTDDTFVLVGIDEITSDLAFLSEYHEHLIRYEGILAAKRVLYDRTLKDNIYALAHIGSIKGRSYDELRAQAILYYPQLREMNNILTQIEVDLSLIGICVGRKDDKIEGLTSRARAIQYIIDIYKKRHDAHLKISKV